MCAKSNLELQWEDFFVEITGPSLWTVNVTARSKLQHTTAAQGTGLGSNQRAAKHEAAACLLEHVLCENNELAASWIQGNNIISEVLIARQHAMQAVDFNTSAPVIQQQQPEGQKQKHDAPEPHAAASQSAAPVSYAAALLGSSSGQTTTTEPDRTPTMYKLEHYPLVQRHLTILHNASKPGQHLATHLLLLHQYIQQSMLTMDITYLDSGTGAGMVG